MEKNEKRKKSDPNKNPNLASDMFIFAIYSTIFEIYNYWPHKCFFRSLENGTELDKLIIISGSIFIGISKYLKCNIINTNTLYT